MKILIVGGTGYVGARLAQHLADRGESVTVTARTLPVGAEAWARRLDGILLGDVRSPELLEQVAERRFDACVYTVSLDHHRSENIDAALDVSVSPTWKIVDLLARSGCKRVVYFSTQQVYGPFEAGGRYDDGAPALPRNAYGFTHAICEELVNYYGRRAGLECASLRLSNAVGAPVFGSSHIDSLVAPDLCRMAIGQRELRLQSDGTPQRNFVLLQDVCDAVTLVLRAPADALHPTFNLGSPTTMTIGTLSLEIAATCETQFGYRPDVFRNDGAPLPRRLGDDSSQFTFGISRLCGLGFDPSRSLRSGIEELLSHYRARADSANR